MATTLTKPISRTTQINQWLSDVLKRIFDIVVSFFVLIFFAPFYIIIALAIKSDSPGPVIFRGTRIGRNGRPFSILKFRTMEETPDSYSGPRVTAHGDPRITSVGRWLRDTKLNEFPQFWNVLVGEMSLVGPRPEDPELAKTWPRTTWNEVLSVRPGITSPASVQYHDEEKLLSNCNVEQMYLSELSPNKMRLDQLYVRYRSFLLDLDVLIWTVLMVLPLVGAYKVPEKLLFFGLISRFIRRFFSWFTIDLITSMIAFGLVGLIFRARAPLDIGMLTSLALTAAFAILFSVMGVIFGTNQTRWSKASPTDFFDLVPAWIVATTIAFLANLLLGFLPSDFILIASVLSLFGFIITRSRKMIITHFLSRSPIFQSREQLVRERVLIIGLGASAEHTAWLFDHLLNSRVYRMVGFVDNDLMMQGMKYYGARVLGLWQDIPELVKKHDVGLIILADYRVDKKGIQEIKKLISNTGARLVVMPDILASINRLVKQANIVAKPGVESPEMDPKCIDCLAQHISQSG